MNSTTLQEKSATSYNVTGNDMGNVRPRGFPGLPEGWDSEWETVSSADGQLQLFCVTHSKREGSGDVRKSNRPRRVLVIVHGLGEHGGRYHHFPYYLNEALDAV